MAKKPTAGCGKPAYPPLLRIQRWVRYAYPPYILLQKSSRAGKPAYPPLLRIHRWVRYAYPPYILLQKKKASQRLAFFAWGLDGEN